MSYPNDAPAAAWYPDPQMAGRVRWWDGTNWTEHVSVPAQPAVPQVTQPAVPQVTQPAVPQIAEADAALAAADAAHLAADPGAQQGFIGRHAAGPSPAPREAPKVPPIRPRQRTDARDGTLLSA